MLEGYICVELYLVVYLIIVVGGPIDLNVFKFVTTVEQRNWYTHTLSVKQSSSIGEILPS